VRIKENWSEQLFSILNYLIMIVLCIVCLYPFIYVFSYSISDGVAASAKNIILLPVKPTLINYKTVFANKTITSAFFISISRTVVGSVLHVIVISMAAYAVSRKNLLWKKKLIMPFFIIPMYFSGGILPTYIIITKLHLNNSFLVYILPMLFQPFHLLLLKVYFEQLPPSLEESARIDGAGDFTVFSRIIFPSSLPVIATVTLFIGVAQWNAWYDAFVYVTKLNLYPLQALLRKIILESQTQDMIDIMKMTQNNVKKQVTSESIKMATVIVATIPIILVYPFLQKYFVKGVMIGAVKE